MKLKKIVENIIKKKSAESLEVKDNHDIDEFLEVPSVVFEDVNLQIKVGQWLEVLYGVKTIGDNTFSFSTSLSTEDFIINGVLEDKLVLNKVNQIFGEVLCFVGIDKNETCVINNYNEEDFSFDIELVNSSSKARVSLRFGSFMDSSPEFIIDYNNVKRKFDYSGLSKEGKIQMSLQDYTIYNSLNGNSYCKLLSPWSSYDIVYNKDIKYRLIVGNPVSISFNESRNYTFFLENNEDLQKYFLDLKMPVDFNDLFKNILIICNISEEDLCKIPIFELSMITLEDGKEVNVVNQIDLKNGVLSKFVFSKDGVIVSSDGENLFKCEVFNYIYGMDVNTIVEDILGNEIFKSFPNDYVKNLRKMD